MRFLARCILSHAQRRLQRSKFSCSSAACIKIESTSLDYNGTYNKEEDYRRKEFYVMSISAQQDKIVFAFSFIRSLETQ